MIADSTKQKNLRMQSNVLSDGIKQTVWEALDKNPLLKPKQLCKLLDLNYEDYRNYVTKLRSDWKYYSRNRRGLKPLKFHNWRGWVYLPKVVDLKDVDVRRVAVGQGWRVTKAKNRMLVWRDENGQLEWFETGRVNLWIRKPANLGKACQLLSNGFFKTALIYDIRVFTPFLKTIRFKGASATVDLGERLPYSRIEFLKDSNGVVVTLGDRSHPTSVEIDFYLPKWAERMEQTVTSFVNTLEKMMNPPVKPGEERNFGVV